jgi:hypothetical protein
VRGALTQFEGPKGAIRVRSTSRPADLEELPSCSGRLANWWCAASCSSCSCARVRRASKELEIVVLRHELSVLRRKVGRPTLRPSDHTTRRELSRLAPHPQPPPVGLPNPDRCSQCADLWRNRINAPLTLIGTLDRVIPRPLQEEMSSRAGAHITRVRAGHLTPIRRPADVAKVILSAVDATT